MLVISNKSFSKVVPIHEGIKLGELNEAILEEFGVKGVIPLYRIGICSQQRKRLLQFLLLTRLAFCTI